MTTDDQKKTKDLILSNAFELFTTKSYFSVSLQDIAEKSKNTAHQFTKGAIFHYFSNKSELALEAISTAITEKISAILEQAEEYDSPACIIQVLIDEMLQLFFQYPRMLLTFIQLPEDADISPEKFNFSIFSEYILLLNESVEKLLTFTNEQAQEVTRLIIVALYGIMIQIYLYKVSSPIDAFISSFRTSIFGYLLKYTKIPLFRHYNNEKLIQTMN